VELRDYLHVLKSRIWIVIQTVVIFTLVAFAYSWIQQPVYQGTATVLVSSQDAGSAILGTTLGELTGQPERSLQTQVQLMQLRSLAETAVRKLGLKESPDALLSHVEVLAAGQTNVVLIRATDTDPQRAANVANEMASAYVAWSRGTKRESIKAAADEVQVRLDQARADILTLGKKIVNTRTLDKNGNIVHDDALQAELTIATNLYATLAEKLETLRVSEQLETGAGRVVATAVANPSAISPKPMRNSMLGLVAGLVVGIAMAFLVEYLDNTIKSTDEAERLYGAPVLGHIPLEQFAKNEKRRLTIVQHPGSSAAESYRALRNSLDFINFEHDIKALLITSSAPSEGKSTVAANLAAGLAQAGHKVALVNSDFRRPTTDQFFDVNNSIGLSDVLLGATTLKSALQRPGDDQLLVLSAGRMPPNPSELLGSVKMSELIDSLKEWADWVIVDSPPVLAVADAAAMARWVDGVLMVSRGGISSRDAARKGREILEKAGGHLAGVVIWGLSESGGGGAYGAYGYDGYYSSYYGYGGYGAAESDSGGDMSLPDKSTGRKVAEFIGRLVAGVLAFVVVLVVILVVLYFLDQYMGWGVVPVITKSIGIS
jgi:non-specific protein-tyrosine kinase